MITDRGWKEFEKWCFEQWPMWAPNRTSVRLYLKWREEKAKRNAV